MMTAQRPSRPTTIFCVNCDESFPDIWAYKRHQDGCAEDRTNARSRESRSCTLVADDEAPS